MNIEEKERLELSAREMFAHAGLAFYWAQLFEKGIIGLIGSVYFYKNHKVWSKQQFMQKLEKMNKKTMRPLLENAMSLVKFSEEDKAFLEKALDTRNRLTHGYFWEHYLIMMDIRGHEKVKSDMLEIQSLFRTASELVDTITINYAGAMGITGDALQSHLDSMVKQKLNAIEE